MAHSFGRNNNNNENKKLITRQTKPRCIISNHRSFCIINGKAIFQYYLLNSIILSNRNEVNKTLARYARPNAHDVNALRVVGIVVRQFNERKRERERHRNAYTRVENRHRHKLSWVIFWGLSIRYHSAQCSFRMHAEPWTHIFIKWNQLKCNSFFFLHRAMN